MGYTRKELSEYRLERAKEALEESELLAESGYWNTSANRLYFACFYSASAYLVLLGQSTSTHNGVKTSFNKELIKTNLLSRKNGLTYNNLFNMRQNADYRDFHNLFSGDVEQFLPEVKSFIQEIEVIIQSFLEK